MVICTISWVVNEATSIAGWLVSKMCVHSEEILTVVLKPSLAPRDAQNLCMVLTVIFVQLLLILSYCRTQLNVVMHQIVKLCSAWELILCGAMSVLFLQARSPSVEPLLLWCCCAGGLMVVQFTERMCLLHRRALKVPPPDKKRKKAEKKIEQM